MQVYVRYHRKRTVAVATADVCQQALVWFLLMLNCVRKVRVCMHVAVLRLGFCCRCLV